MMLDNFIAVLMIISWIFIPYFVYRIVTHLIDRWRWASFHSHQDTIKEWNENQ